MRTGSLAGTLVALLLAGGGAGWVMAQDAPTTDAPDAVTIEEAAAEAADDTGLLGDDELDELVAPVALYPDSLLTQVLVASTYPIDLIKADRFLGSNEGLSDKDRRTQAEQEDWDPSVQVLTAGFPTVVQRMATEIDWTEELGDAMLAQSDDVLDSVQRQRARAVAVGNLSTNDAQVVDQTDDNISIEPASPDVVYVPQYDTTTAFTTPYTTAPVINSGPTAGSLLTTGAIAFGSALLIDEIFDNDDDDWDNYWRPGPRYIDWDDANIHPRPDVNIGDVAIDRDRTINIDRNRVNIDRDRVNIDRNRVGNKNVDRKRIGDAGADRATWKPSPEKKAEARDRLASRERPAGKGKAAQTREKLKAGGGDNAKISRGDVGKKLGQQKGGGGRGDAARARPSAGDVGAKLANRESGGKGKAKAKPGSKGSALKPKNQDAGKAKKAARRGDRSVNKAKAKKARDSHPKAVSRAKSAKPPKKVSPKKKSAFKKGSGGKAHAAKARAGKRGGGRRR